MTAVEPKPELSHEETVDPKVEVHNLDSDDLAHLANQEAHDETVLVALKKHPWTVAWCVYGIWILLLCAFDNTTGGSVVSIPWFRHDYGYAFEGDYVLPANWQSAYSGGPAAASVIGTVFSGYAADILGRKWTVLIGYLLLIVGITVETISHSQSDPNAVFFAGKFINGLAIGALISTGMVYIGELAPLRLRGIMTTAAAISFTVGGFINTLITNSYGSLDNAWAYKSTFVAQYGVTGIGLLLWPFMPESPTWLVLKGKDATGALKRLGDVGDEATKRIALIQLTLDESARETDGATWAECFKRSNLRRTIVGCAPLTIQQFCGISWVAGYATYYFQLAGYSSKASFTLAVVQQVISMLGNITAWPLIDRVGRRSLSIWGLVILTVVLMLTGGLATIGTISGNKAAVGFIILYCYLYNATIGATAYVAMSEIATTRLRQKTASLALLSQGCWSCMWNFVLPYLFNPNAANLQAKTAFIFGGFSIICIVYLYFYHPETAHRSYEELDEMFAKKIPARKFKGFKTDSEMRAAEVQRRVEGTEEI